MRDSDAPDDEVETRFLNAAIGCAYYFKDASFSEEEEWRLVSPRIDIRELYFRSGKSMMLPYYKLKFPEISSEVPIAHVVVGPCPHVELARSSIQMLLMREHIGVVSLVPLGIPSVMPQVLSSKIPYRHW
jgi:hypothetical protein